MLSKSNLRNLECKITTFFPFHQIFNNLFTKTLNKKLQLNFTLTLGIPAL